MKGTIASACPGPCNRDWRANKNNAAADVTPIVGEPLWCVADTRRIRAALHDLLELHVRLDLDQAARTHLADLGTIRGSGGHPTPSAQVDLQDETLRLLQWIEDEIRAARPGMAPRGARTVRLAPSAGRWTVETLPAGMYGPPRLLNATSARQRLAQAVRRPRPTDRDLAARVRFIDAHLDWLLDQADPGEWAGKKLLQQHALLRSATATGSGRSRRTQRCPRCKLKALIQEPGATYIQCEECGRLISLDEYADLCVPDRQNA